MKKEIICTVCPMGCHITVEGEADQIQSISGYTCKRGEEYGCQEFISPVRILTTTVRTDNRKQELLPVRSNSPVPKDRIMDCMEIIKKVEVKGPVKRYDVIVENICGCGADIVASGELK